MNDVDKEIESMGDAGQELPASGNNSQKIDESHINGVKEEYATVLTDLSGNEVLTEIALVQPEPKMEESVIQKPATQPPDNRPDNHVIPTIQEPSLDASNAAVSLEDISSDSSLHSIEKSPSQSCFINDIESKYLEEQANLKTKLQDTELQCSKLSTVVTEKDVAIDSLRQEKTLLEREKQMMKKELDLAMKEKENAVMRYVTVERSVLEAKSSQEVSEKKVKVMHKEVEVLNGKIKMMSTEKTRICGLLDSKVGARKIIDVANQL